MLLKHVDVGSLHSVSRSVLGQRHKSESVFSEVFRQRNGFIFYLHRTHVNVISSVQIFIHKLLYIFVSKRMKFDHSVVRICCVFLFVITRDEPSERET